MTGPYDFKSLSGRVCRLLDILVSVRQGVAMNLVPP